MRISGMAYKTTERFHGLTPEQVKKQRSLFGSNELTRRRRKRFLRKFFESFNDPLIKVLLTVLGINIIMLFRSFDWYESAGVALAILVATLVSTISEYGSESTFEKLQAEAADICCRVQRSGETIELPIGEIVVDDLILLQTGDKIPADGAIISGKIDVDQSTLNGETKEIAKSAAGNQNAAADLLSAHAVFRGTVVCAGEAVMRATAVGDQTYYGKLSHEIQEETRKSPLKTRLERLASRLSMLGYIGAGVVAVANLFNHIFIQCGFDFSRIGQYLGTPSNVINLVLETITLCVIVIVVAVPEGLPMMITIVLSANMRRMMKDHVLVRKLVGIETAGSLNILFTDKTGTLTRGKLKVHSFLSGDGKMHAAFGDTDNALFRLLYMAIALNNGAVMSGRGTARRAIGGNATDRALLEFADRNARLIPPVEKLEQLPFDSQRKFSCARIAGAYNLTLVAGAPEKVLSACTRCYDIQGARRPFAAKAVEGKLRQMALNSVRFIAVATAEKPIAHEGAFPELTLIGLIGIRDEVRPEAKPGVRAVQGAGVQIVMITGDSPETASAIAGETGILSSSRDLALSSADIAAMNDEQLKRALPNLRVLARALPADKSRLVRLAQELNMVVGMTGDGVNDAPALKKADVGFAMGSGTEVAKEAGDIVILNDNILSIAKAILYGRTIFHSIRKFTVFQLTVNLCAVGLSIIGPMLGIDMPVTVLQMLWVNMVMDTLAGIAFAGEPPLSEYMREKPKRRDENIVGKPMVKQILFIGSYIILLCLAFLKLPAFSRFIRPTENNIYFLTAFFALFMFAVIFNSFNARSSHINPLAHIGRNPAFLIVMILVCAVQLGLLYFGGALFRTAALTPRELLYCMALAFTVIPMDLMRKAMQRRRSEKL
ncbi:MAG: calcium-translocating P-type ATPase, PMCA-type [Clostridiales bacterium]|nr:calcium-translocating P-type ATPase, PMCA-type [Clostridiales bacterium]